MSHFNLLHYFDRIVSGADLPAKPEPEVFLEAARQLKRKAGECLVIEDSLPGVKAAKNAGMKCIAVSTTMLPAELSMADKVVDDFTQPVLPMLAELGFEVR